MSSWGSPLLDPKKLQNQQFYIIDWIRKKLLVDVATLATCCHDDYDVLLEVLGPWASAMLVVLLPKLWKLWLAQLFLDVFLGLTLTGPKKASKPTILHNRLNKELKLLVDVANLATCCHDDYDVLLEVLGTLSKCYVSKPLAKTLVWVENHDWHNCFWMSSWGSPLLDPKKLQNQQFYIIDWIRKKLLVDVATLATCCHDDYDVLLEVLGTLGKCYVSNPVAKPLVWIENHDWHNCFWMSSWGSPLLDSKKLQNQQFYKIDWIRKKPWSMLPIWLLAAMMIMMYYWRFWEPWASAMLVVLLPKLWFDWKSWLAQLFLDVFLGLTLTGPKKASKPTILHNRLN